MTRPPNKRVSRGRPVRRAGGPAKKADGCLMVPLRFAVAMVATGVLMLAGQWHAIPLAWLVYLHVSVRPLFSGRPAPAQHSGDVPPASARMQTALSGRPVTNSPSPRTEGWRGTGQGAGAVLRGAAPAPTT